MKYGWRFPSEIRTNSLQWWGCRMQTDILAGLLNNLNYYCSFNHKRINYHVRQRKPCIRIREIWRQTSNSKSIPLSSFKLSILVSYFEFWVLADIWRMLTLAILRFTYVNILLSVVILLFAKIIILISNHLPFFVHGIL